MTDLSRIASDVNKTKEDINTLMICKSLELNKEHMIDLATRGITQCMLPKYDSEFTKSSRFEYCIPRYSTGLHFDIYEPYSDKKVNDKLSELFGPKCKLYKSYHHDIKW